MRILNLELTLTLLLGVIIFPSDTVAREFFGIIDYKPSSFSEVADEPFFYSIGKTLRYGRTISDNAPVLFSGTLFGGDLALVYDSPDHKKAAIVYGGNLYVAEATVPARLLLESVDNYAGQEIRQGDLFYKYPTLQWDEKSRSIYIVRDKKQSQLKDQIWSRDATLVRIEIDTPNKSIDVIQNFRSLNYFFVGNEAICFNYSPDDGSVVWKCSHQGKVGLVRSHHGEQIVLEDGVVEGRPFVSYHPGNIYESEIWLTNYGFSLRKTSDDTFAFFSGSDHQTPIFKIRGGYNFKGEFMDGIAQTGCKVLPGGRFALLNVHHDTFAGQLLVDGQTGKYRELPSKTRIWWNLNSSNYKHFKFDIGPTKWPEFVPAARLRTSE